VTLALAGLAMGFLGSAHCVGMCGGIAGALSAVSPGAATHAVKRSLAYNVGRMGSYSLMGALAGAFGASLAGLAGPNGMLALRVLAALLIVVAGLHLAGWSAASARIERAGASVWRRIAPLARRAHSASSPLAALALGSLWGWLPCGLLYSALSVAAASGSGAEGALFMAAFGLGTLPALLSLGLFAGRGASLLRAQSARAACGVLVMAFGVWTMLGAVSAARTVSESGACHHQAATSDEANHVQAPL
jgi:uncharacterized protein